MIDQTIQPLQPFFIVGAGRSGTTMLRQALGNHKDIVNFEFEMNHLWRFGNETLTHDLLTPELHLNNSIKQYIRNAFEKELLKGSGKFVLDKTVANVMRLRFVEAVFPSAKFLHIIRDGRAVVSSAKIRWDAPNPAYYYLQKAKTVPLQSLPIIVCKKAINFSKSFFLNGMKKTTWGPRWPEFDSDANKLSLNEMCAKQWCVSVETALQQAKLIQQKNYMEVRYEELVSEPLKHFERICEFFCIDLDEKMNEWINHKIKKDKVDSWKNNLSEYEQEQIAPHTKHLLGKLGYL